MASPQPTYVELLPCPREPAGRVFGCHMGTVSVGRGKGSTVHVRGAGRISRHQFSIVPLDSPADSAQIVHRGRNPTIVHLSASHTVKLSQRGAQCTIPDDTIVEAAGLRFRITFEEPANGVDPMFYVPQDNVGPRHAADKHSAGPPSAVTPSTHRMPSLDTLVPDTSVRLQHRAATVAAHAVDRPDLPLELFRTAYRF